MLNGKRMTIATFLLVPPAGAYILENIPPPRGGGSGISADVIWGKNMKRRKEKGEKVIEKGRKWEEKGKKWEEKGKKGKENAKRGSKRIFK